MRNLVVVMSNLVKNVKMDILDRLDFLPMVYILNGNVLGVLLIIVRFVILKFYQYAVYVIWVTFIQKMNENV